MKRTFVCCTGADQVAILTRGVERVNVLVDRRAGDAKAIGLT